MPRVKSKTPWLAIWTSLSLLNGLCWYWCAHATYLPLGDKPNTSLWIFLTKVFSVLAGLTFLKKVVPKIYQAPRTLVKKIRSRKQKKQNEVSMHWASRFEAEQKKQP